MINFSFIRSTDKEKIVGHIKISKGLDIPIKGEPVGDPTELIPSGHANVQAPFCIALNLSCFSDVKFRVLVKEEDHVKIGQPLAEDKECPGRLFVAPAAGTIREIRRGLKRRLLDIIIQVDSHEEIDKHSIISLEEMSRAEIIEKLKLGGLFTHIRQRPFNLIANPNNVPRSIFIKALESAPFTPPSEMQVTGYEKEFQEGLNTLKRLTEGPVHLIYKKGSTFSPFINAQGVEKHTAEGPYPISNVSIHIEKLDPIYSVDDVIWTLDAHTVVAIGYFLLHGSYFTPRIVSVAGPGIVDGKTGYFRVREGFPISNLIAGRLKNEFIRIISGNVLTGHQVTAEDFLGYEDTCISVVPENTKRKFLHFFRLNSDSYTKSGAYLSAHLNSKNSRYDFSNQHGEERPFIDATMYDEVMPLKIATMPLVKAVLAEDFDLAAKLGLLEVDGEDFALPTFVCPSKIEMVEIINNGLKKYAQDTLK